MAGGYCKAGFAGNKNPTAVVPNCLGRPHSSKKWLIGDQLHHCDDIAALSLRRPFDRGYLINADMQKEIWDRLFKHLLKIRPSDSAGLLLVEPLFNLPSIQKATDELVFEDLGFQSLYVADSPSLVHLYEASRSPISLLARTQCSLVVDCGFSFTHAAPVYQNFTINYGVKRIDLGGKALTNYLKELVSYRAVNMMDETYIMDDVKEKLCFVSLDVAHDLEVARKAGNANPIRSTYVLPDGIKHIRGFVKDPEGAQRYLSIQGKETPPMVPQEEGKEHDISPEVEIVEDRNKEASAKNDELKLTNERFLVPEMLFHPADLGMNQAGLAECIVRAVNSCHPHLHPVLFSSDGTATLPGWRSLPPRTGRRSRNHRPAQGGSFVRVFQILPTIMSNISRQSDPLPFLDEEYLACFAKSEQRFQNMYPPIGSLQIQSDALFQENTPITPPMGNTLGEAWQGNDQFIAGYHTPLQPQAIQQTPLRKSTASSPMEVISALAEKVRGLELAQVNQNSYFGQAGIPNPLHHPSQVDLLTGTCTLGMPPQNPYTYPQ
ncbi:hypothetical protein KI387_030424 [Taxus chinensis]|uniref:Actin-related protein 6 n=1 Tax=Taxus chinensis TaxID=29808 RepID=A0AA38CDG4_TAXCH|nr:hypothetical protein KI387_030424 [Taxus chinensis]